MTIKNHRLDGAPYVASPNKGGRITPKFVVMHYTAGYTATSAINTLTRKGSGVSAHVTVDLDGTITQHVPFNVKAWHAGPSKHMGYSGLNSHSIGIEIVNIGFLRKVAGGYQDAYGNVKQYDDKDLVEAASPRAGSGKFYWPRYTQAQLDAVYSLTKELVDKYDIVDIVTHEEIDTRGWKTDPGPAFPMKLYTNLLNNRSTDFDTYEVTASILNVRFGPGGSFTVSRKLSRGEKVEVLDTRGDWAKITEDEWVHNGFLRRI
jgi:N-acetylmuramoyl-L-alanine amidase